MAGTPHSHRDWWRSLTGVCSDHSTAPHTAVPAKASGTFNPLHKVLCILQSLYLCTIGPTVVLLLARDTPGTSNCSLKQLYSWIRPAEVQAAMAQQSSVGDSIPLLWSIPGHLPGATASKDKHCQSAPQPTALVEPCDSRPPEQLSPEGTTEVGWDHFRLSHEVLPVHSPLLEQSQLLALPPLSDMLKFSGSFPMHQVTHKPQP